MSYSAFFTAGLTLASQPRDYESSFSKLPPPLQINVHPGTPRRTRKRRSSLTIATSPIGTIKSPARTANDAARSVIRSSPRESTFLEALQHGTRPKMARRKTVSNVKDLPSLPAPTTPLPTVPNLRIDKHSSAPMTPTDEVYPSSPIAVDSTRPPHHSGSLRANPARKSSFLLPIGRGALLPSAYAGNIPDDSLHHDSDTDTLADVKCVPAAELYDEEEEMKENGGDV